MVPDQNYASGRATALAVRVVPGPEVEVAPVPVRRKAPSRDTGAVDIWAGSWLANQIAPKTKTVGEESPVTVGAKSVPAAQGCCMSKATAVKNNVRQLCDLANPENTALFQQDGERKPELWIGLQGRLSTGIGTIRARDYGCAGRLSLQPGDEAMATAGLYAAVKADRACLGSCYGPQRNFAICDLSLLREHARNS